MRIYKLDKKVLHVHGNAAHFLNGLTSNTLDAPRNAFLNLHGRIIATFEQLPQGEDGFYLIVASFAVQALKDHVDRFARLNKTTIDVMDLNVYFDLDNKDKLILTKDNLAPCVSDEEFTQFRLDHHIPLHGIDYKDEMVLNVSMTDFVSFTKGCFLGQEPVAKVYNRSKPTWKLAVVQASQLNEEQRSKMTSCYTAPKTGDMQGFAFVPFAA